MPYETIVVVSAVLAVFAFFAGVTLFSDLTSKEH
jgi:hypothetical protein